MKNNIIISTDVDGTLLNEKTFKYGNNANYIKKLISHGIIVILNTSKTKYEVLRLLKKMKLNIPFISENGSAIHFLNKINVKFSKEIRLSKDKKIIFKNFKKKIKKELFLKCRFLSDMNIKEQCKIFGLSKKDVNYALRRDYTTSFIFNGLGKDKKKLIQLSSRLGLNIQEGGRVLNLGDNVKKSMALKKIVSILNKHYSVKHTTIGVGDNFNDVSMLKSSNIPCLVKNHKFNSNILNIKNLLTSNNTAPRGWYEVVKLALEKNY